MPFGNIDNIAINMQYIYLFKYPDKPVKHSDKHFCLAKMFRAKQSKLYFFEKDVSR